MNLKAGLVGRVVLPGDVDPAAGHGDDVSVGWGVRGRRRQRRRAGGGREVGVARPAVCPLERADLVTVLRRRVEPADLVTVLRFLFKDTAATDIYTLALRDALPICTARSSG